MARCEPFRTTISDSMIAKRLGQPVLEPVENDESKLIEVARSQGMQYVCMICVLYVYYIYGNDI